MKKLRKEKFLRPFGSKRPEVERKSLRIEELKFLSLAALLMAGAAFTACSSSDEIIAEQPVNPTEPQVYTMVIKAYKGGASREQNGTRSNSAEAQPALGEAKGDATTRALKPGKDSDNKNTVDAYWSGNETFDVVQYTGSGNIFKKIGTATAAASPNGETTITATLTEAPNTSWYMNFLLNGSTWDYTGQVGLLTGTGGNSISEKYDYATATLLAGDYTVDGLNVTLKSGVKLDFSNTCQAIVKFTLVDKRNNDAPIKIHNVPVTMCLEILSGILYERGVDSKGTRQSGTCLLEEVSILNSFPLQRM